jgi:nucleotidyltransferase substrate binding protein (TIGR01987 family)
MTEDEIALSDRRALLEQALARLDEALLRDPQSDPLVLDATIQRFEFCIELCWRMLKARLLLEGLDARSPRATLREAYSVGWIDNEELWIAMMKDRNLTVHTYKQQVALEVWSRLPLYAAAMRSTLAIGA